MCSHGTQQETHCSINEVPVGRYAVAPLVIPPFEFVCSSDTQDRERA